MLAKISSSEARSEGYVRLSNAKRCVGALKFGELQQSNAFPSPFPISKFCLDLGVPLDDRCYSCCPLSRDSPVYAMHQYFYETSLSCFLPSSQMTLLNQRLGREHDVYFDDCHVEPGAEWAAFFKKLHANAQQEPITAKSSSLEVDYQEGLPGGWIGKVESVPDSAAQSATEDPLLKVIRRLDQGAEVRRLQRGECGLSKIQIVGGASDMKVVSKATLHGEGFRVLTAGGLGVGSLTNVDEKDEAALGVSFAVDGTKLTEGTETGGQSGEIEEESKLDGRDDKEAGFPPPSATAAYLENEKRSVASMVKPEAVNRFLMLLPGGLPVAGILARQESEAARKDKDASRSQAGKALPLVDFHFAREVRKVAVNGEDLPLWEGDEATLAAAVIEAYGARPMWRVWDPSASKDVGASFPVLEAALELFELLVVGARRIWVLGGNNRVIPGPLVPLVRALGKSLRKSMSPVVFWHAATVGAELIDFCGKIQSIYGIEQVLTVLSGLKYIPALGSRLVKPQPGFAANAGGGRGGTGLEAERKGKEPEAEQKGKGPEAERNGLGPEAEQKGKGPEEERNGKGPEAERTGKGPEAERKGKGPDADATRKKLHPAGPEAGGTRVGAVPRPGGDKEPGQVAALTAAYEYLAQCAVHDGECRTLGEKLAAVGAKSIFNDPEMRGTTSAGKLGGGASASVVDCPQCWCPRAGLRLFVD